MVPEISLQEVYQHPVVAEIISENKALRATLSEKPEVKDLNDVPLPYTIKRHILINEGVHNGLFYSAQILRMALNQHEGLSLFLDHHPNNQGGTVLTWCGSIINPSWSEADKAIVADVDVVDPKTAIALAYGAKFGISATVDVDTIETKAHTEAANDPVFKSYSIVLDPAVRETMLNENDTSKSEENQKEGEEKEMSDELDIKSDLKPALDKVDDAIRRASAMKDTSLLTTLQQTKAILSKLAGTEYPYPKPGAMEELEGKFVALEQLITAKLLPSEPPSTPPVPEKNEELEAVSKENETLKTQLEAIEHEKLVVRADGILNKELELGLILAADSEARKKELEAMNATSLDAIEGNLDKTLKILETTPSAADSKPEQKKEGTRKELGKDVEKAHDQTILDMMLSEQTHHRMPLGGF
jgi:hypothetical protein